MASRVATVPIFYVTEAGVIYQPVSAEDSERVDHDVEESRVRLANILRSRKQQKEKLEQEKDQKLNQEEEKHISNNETEESEDEEEDDGNGNINFTTDLDLAIRRIEVQQRAGSLVDREQQLKMNKLLARGARMSKNGSSKAIASQFVHKEKPADNAAARAVVHHTGSHYVMAGGVQFQRGLRVKGVVSRHSKQGAKLQAARTAQRNMYEAREDARGERTEGAGRSQGKAKKSKNKKKDQDA